MTEAEQLAAKLAAEQPYLRVRVLPDGSVAALWDLLYTRAILLGCDEDHFERRYCFKDRELASQRFDELQSENDEPQGYIATR